MVTIKRRRRHRAVQRLAAVQWQQCQFGRQRAAGIRALEPRLVEPGPVGLIRQPILDVRVRLVAVVRRRLLEVVRRRFLAFVRPERFAALNGRLARSG